MEYSPFYLFSPSRVKYYERLSFVLIGGGELKLAKKRKVKMKLGREAGEVKDSTEYVA